MSALFHTPMLGSLSPDARPWYAGVSGVGFVSCTPAKFVTGYEITEVMPQVQANDVVLCFAFARGNLTYSEGWTLLGSVKTPVANHTLYVFRKDNLSPTDVGSVISVIHSVNDRLGISLFIARPTQDSILVEELVTEVSSANTATIAAPTVTAEYPGELIVGAVTGINASTSSLSLVAPTGWTGAALGPIANNRLGVAYGVLDAGQTSGTGTWSMTATGVDKCAMTLRLVRGRLRGLR